MMYWVHSCGCSSMDFVVVIVSCYTCNLNDLSQKSGLFLRRRNDLNGPAIWKTSCRQKACKRHAWTKPGEKENERKQWQQKSSHHIVTHKLIIQRLYAEKTCIRHVKTKPKLAMHCTRRADWLTSYGYAVIFRNSSTVLWRTLIHIWSTLIQLYIHKDFNHIRKWLLSAVSWNQNSIWLSHKMQAKLVSMMR